jgi:hypothetical protein
MTCGKRTSSGRYLAGLSVFFLARGLLRATTARPAYVPQDGHARCGIIGSLHFGQVVRGSFLRAKCAALRRLCELVRR